MFSLFLDFLDETFDLLVNRHFRIFLFETKRKHLWQTKINSRWTHEQVFNLLSSNNRANLTENKSYRRHISMIFNHQGNLSIAHFIVACRSFLWGQYFNWRVFTQIFFSNVLGLKFTIKQETNETSINKKKQMRHHCQSNFIQSVIIARETFLQNRISKRKFHRKSDKRDTLLLNFDLRFTVVL